MSKLDKWRARILGVGVDPIYSEVWVRPVTFDLTMAKSRACVQFASCHASCREIGTSTSINHGRLGDFVGKPSERLNSGDNLSRFIESLIQINRSPWVLAVPLHCCSVDWANGATLQGHVMCIELLHIPLLHVHQGWECWWRSFSWMHTF